jgi:hypothetical protein
VKRTGRVALLVGLAAAACGRDGKDEQVGQAEKPVPEQAEPRPAPSVNTAPLALGVARPTDLAYEWGKGARAFAAAAAAHKKQDWVHVRSGCEEAIEADAGHLDAHRLLASALAQQGEYESAIQHLQAALAGDWTRWGGGVEGDPDLEPVLSSPLGASVKQMLAAYREEFARRARTGLLVVARRAAFKEPTRSKKAGAPARLASRAEVFAYSVATRRYVRITQTGFQVLGALPSPSGDEIAYVAATHVALPAPAAPPPASPSGSAPAGAAPPAAPPAAPAAAAPPILATVQVGAVSLASPDLKMRPATLRNARAVSIEYLAGDELVATTYDPQGPWALGAAHSFTIDRADGTAKPTRSPAGAPAAPAAGAPAAPGRRLLVRYETVEIHPPGETDGIAADWNPETGTAEEFVIDSSKKRVQLPAGEAALRSSLVWSHDKTRLAFATAADPCAALPVDRQAALYLVEAESGKLKHVFKGATRLLPRFADRATLAFEDDQGNIRLYDAAVTREVGRLENRPGLSFAGLGALPRTSCPGQPPPAAPAAAEAGAPAPTAPPADTRPNSDG